MSSSVESGASVAMAVMVPAAAAAAITAVAAYGTGWLAWQGGKLLVEANKAVDRQIEEQKRQIEEQALHRKMRAVSAHAQLVDMCTQIRSQLESENFARGTAECGEIEQLKYDLQKICEEHLPEDVTQIESLTSLGYLKLDKVMRQKNRIVLLKLSDSESGLYHGLVVADLMDDLRIAVETMEIETMRGRDIKAADPVVLERMRLNEQFADAANQVIQALDFIDELAATYGLTKAGNAWFSSCFYGIDELIEKLYRPTTSNQEMKRGIRRLEESVEQYRVMAASIEKETIKMHTLYKVYADASEALSEPIESIQSFNSSAELEKKLKWLQQRAEKARECAEIYKRLGRNAYLCYAWDQELKAMGYEVHTRKKIIEMTDRKPQYAKLGNDKLPFYQWNEKDLTQLYSITDQCAMQLIVHDDRTVSMQTIADENNDEAVSVQQRHCIQLKALRNKLRENWFIQYDSEEIQSPEKVITVADWRNSENYAWKDSESELIMDQRVKSEDVVNVMRMQ